MTRSVWQLPYGAEFFNVEQRGTRFRVAAVGKTKVEVALAEGDSYRFVPLDPEGDGNFSCWLPEVQAGTRYKFRIDGDLVVPDPYTRWQPDDVHGNSVVVDPTAYQWQDDGWQGRRLAEMIIYELHVGAFTYAGTFAAIIDQFDYLLKLGINTIELMPLGDFPGRRNWGYDGVQYFAPDAAYGNPEDLKRLIDIAHQHGLAVIIDVVYNHFGPDGNYLWSYSRNYFTPHHKTPWGDALNYDGAHKGLMRTYVLNNACYWIHEYHADGLRLDASFAMIDESERHILQEIVDRLQTQPRAGLPVTIIAEDHRNLAMLHWPPPEGYGIDGQWVDDFHHAIHCYFTGEHDGYYQNYQGNLAEIIKSYNDGFIFQGEHYHFGEWNGPRGTAPTRLRGEEMVICIQNHDQVGNRAFGERLNHLVDRDTYHLATALLLLAPYTPLLFMGQEYAAKEPFLFFTDHHEELGRAVTTGRRKEFQNFAAFADPARLAEIPDPQDETTFRNSQLDLTDHQRPPYSATFLLYQRLLRLIGEKPALMRRERRLSVTSSPGPDLLVLLRRGEGDEESYLILANLAAQERSFLLAALTPQLQGLRWPDWCAPIFSTLATDFAGTGSLPDERSTELILPSRSLFLYSC
ncbi:MAG: malto-oligosyltrehalose trehalohydrolase [Acidobacteriota bacterium]